MQKGQHDSEKPSRSKDPMRSKEELPQTLIGFQPSLNTPGSWKSMAKAYGINGNLQSTLPLWMFSRS